MSSYIVAPLVGIDPGRTRTLVDLLCYAIGRGQRELPSLRYTPLSASDRATAQARINRIAGVGNDACAR
jgi:hypothetical protein